MSETPSEAPAMTPEEEAVNQAHSDVNEADQTWGEKVEGRLRAIEEKVGLADPDTAAEADTKEEK